MSIFFNAERSLKELHGLETELAKPGSRPTDEIKEKVSRLRNRIERNLTSLTVSQTRDFNHTVRVIDFKLSKYTLSDCFGKIREHKSIVEREMRAGSLAQLNVSRVFDSLSVILDFATHFRFLPKSQADEATFKGLTTEAEVLRKKFNNKTAIIYCFRALDSLLAQSRSLNPDGKDAAEKLEALSTKYAEQLRAFGEIDRSFCDKDGDFSANSIVSMFDKLHRVLLSKKKSSVKLPHEGPQLLPEPIGSAVKIGDKLRVESAQILNALKGIKEKLNASPTHQQRVQLETDFQYWSAKAGQVNEQVQKISNNVLFPRDQRVLEKRLIKIQNLNDEISGITTHSAFLKCRKAFLDESDLLSAKLNSLDSSSLPLTGKDCEEIKLQSQGVLQRVDLAVKEFNSRNVCLSSEEINELNNLKSSIAEALTKLNRLAVPSKETFSLRKTVSNAVRNLEPKRVLDYAIGFNAYQGGMNRDSLVPDSFGMGLVALRVALEAPKLLPLVKKIPSVFKRAEKKPEPAKKPTPTAPATSLAPHGMALMAQGPFAQFPSTANQIVASARAGGLSASPATVNQAKQLAPAAAAPAAPAPAQQQAQRPPGVTLNLFDELNKLNF